MLHLPGPFWDTALGFCVPMHCWRLRLLDCTWMDGWMDGWMDRWMDGWMDGYACHGFRRTHFVTVHRWSFLFVMWLGSCSRFNTENRQLLLLNLTIATNGWVTSIFFTKHFQLRTVRNVRSSAKTLTMGAAMDSQCSGKQCSLKHYDFDEQHYKACSNT